MLNFQDEKLKFRSKIESLVKNLNCIEKLKFWSNIYNFGQWSD